MPWPHVALGDVCEIVSGATPKTAVRAYWGGSVHWATPKNLSLLPGSVLLSSRAPIGHVAINTVPMATNQGFKSLVPGERMNAGYLYHWLKFKRPLLESLGNGATFKELSKATVSSIEVPLQPIDEQQRMVNILDRAETLRAQRRRSVALLDDLAQSSYDAHFGAPAARAGAVETVALGDVALVTSGITVGRRTTAPTRETPYMTVANVQDRRLNVSTVKTIAATQAEIDKYRLVTGDLLLTEGGDPDKLGRGSLWGGEVDCCIHQNHVFRVRVTRPDLVDPTYWNWNVGSQQGKAYFLRSAKQATGIASINLTQLKAFPLRLPSLLEQQRFASQLAANGRVAETAARELKELDGLIGALQRAAFRGEL